MKYCIIFKKNYDMKLTEVLEIRILDTKKTSNEKRKVPWD